MASLLYRWLQAKFEELLHTASHGPCVTASQLVLHALDPLPDGHYEGKGQASVTGGDGETVCTSH